MAEYPIAWEGAQSIDQLANTCPYSVVEMEEYLFGNHYHWTREEEPTTFYVSGPRAQREDADRRYWLFEARDQSKQRQWFVIVGTGKSPFDPRKRMRRWMYAETNDNNLSPNQFLNEAYRQQIAADAQ